MQQTYNTVIADTSCFILLNKIEEIEILKKLFQTVYTTTDVLKEFGKPLPDWIIIKESKDKHYQEIIELEIDKGEASVIALSYEIENSLLILDDLKARKLAEKLQLNYTGTFGIIVKAKQSGKIDSVKPILEKIKLTNFRFSNKIFNEILKQV